LRVISLVPSLTETLLDCGVNVVGRTRFCIHPADKVSQIPAVGGTKAVDWERCAALKPDLIVMDREENTREMAESCPYDWVATHITSVNNVGVAMLLLAERIDNEPLNDLAQGWNELAAITPQAINTLSELPGLECLVGDPAGDIQKIEYLIWRDPWMSIGQQTFIGSVLTLVGLGHALPDHPVPYPALDEDVLPELDTLYLFSTEPFPFARYVAELTAQGFHGAVVDGEFYSWFGSRSYRLLKSHLLQVTAG